MTGLTKTVLASFLQRYAVSLGMRPIVILSIILTRIRNVFNDFGPKFTCVDPTGEQPLTGMIVSVDKVGGSLMFGFFFYVAVG